MQFRELIGEVLYLIPAQHAAHVCALRRVTVTLQEAPSAPKEATPTCKISTYLTADLRFASFRKSVDQTEKGSVDQLNNVSLRCTSHGPTFPLSLAKMCRDVDKMTTKRRHFRSVVYPV